MPEPLQMLMPQVKDLADQKPGKFVIVTISAASGQLLPMYADDYSVEDGYFTAVRQRYDEAGLKIDDEYDDIYAAPAGEVKVFATSLLQFKTWEEMEREGTVEMKARRKLQAELQPETVPVFVPGVGIMPKGEAERMYPAITDMLKDRNKGGSPDGAYR